MNQVTTQFEEHARANVQERLLNLAGVYRSLNRKELAQALRRDGSKLAASNGNPKLDYLVALAEVLDWPIGDVAEVIWGAGTDESPSTTGDDVKSLDAAAMTAHRNGEYEIMCELAHRMSRAATTPDERALAVLREAGSWDGRGRYARQLEVLRSGLQEGATAADLRLLLEVNLANAHYALGSFFEARALAGDVLGRLEPDPPKTRRTRAAQAFGYYVLGNAARQMMSLVPSADVARSDAETARAALQRSLELYTALADDFDHDPWRGIANTCRGGILEIEVELGRKSAHEALAVIDGEIDADLVKQTSLFGDQLESCGWWCIFGCNIAIRHLKGRDQQQRMATLINRGNEIANRLNNWSMHERLFTMEFAQRQQLDDLAGFSVDWAIDEDVIKLLVGTMGRFPSFRSTGWKILKSTTIKTNT